MSNKSKKIFKKSAILPKAKNHNSSFQIKTYTIPCLSSLLSLSAMPSVDPGQNSHTHTQREHLARRAVRGRRASKSVRHLRRIVSIWGIGEREGRYSLSLTRIEVTCIYIYICVCERGGTGAGAKRQQQPRQRLYIQHRRGMGGGKLLSLSLTAVLE